MHLTRTVTSLGHHEGWSFPRRPKFFELCPMVLSYVQHIFPGGGEKFCTEASPSAPPGYGPAPNQSHCSISTAIASRRSMVSVVHFQLFPLLNMCDYFFSLSLILPLSFVASVNSKLGKRLHSGVDDEKQKIGEIK